MGFVNHYGLMSGDEETADSITALPSNGMSVADAAQEMKNNAKKIFLSQI